MSARRLINTTEAGSTITTYNNSPRNFLPMRFCDEIAPQELKRADVSRQKELKLQNTHRGFLTRGSKLRSEPGRTFTSRSLTTPRIFNHGCDHCRSQCDDEKMAQGVPVNSGVYVKAREIVHSTSASLVILQNDLFSNSNCNDYPVRPSQSCDRTRFFSRRAKFSMLIS
jgi:hypothetical protein